MYRYVQPQGQGYGHLSKYLIYDFIYQFFHSIMKKKFKVFSKKNDLLMYLSSIKTELAINFLKKNFCTWPKKGLELKGLTLSRPIDDI